MEAFFYSHKEAVAFLIATVGGGFALWRWTIDQRWRRVQYAHELVEKFFIKDNTKLALRLLDTSGYQELRTLSGDGEKEPFTITEELLISSLLTLQQQAMFEEPQFTIRLILDEFFTDLCKFQHHIEAKLIKVEDVQPYLVYWIKSINGYGPIYGKNLATQINAFLKSFDYDPILKLSESMGYPYRSAIDTK
jgi:hypothetical protein